MPDNEIPRIEQRENGPLVVKNVKRLVDEDGTEREVKPLMVLCRCGGSKNKPFCDGSHKKNGFQSSGGKPAGRDRLIAYEGSEVTVYYNPLTCSHAAECGRIAGNVFDASQKPWIQPDNGTLAEIEAVVAACPSGALQMSAPGESAEHRMPDRAMVQIQKDGPLWITGMELDVPRLAEGMSERKYVLCRCGKSGNKPYCDGTHRDEGWKSGD